MFNNLIFLTQRDAEVSAKERGEENKREGRGRRREGEYFLDTGWVDDISDLLVWGF
jgi:hypothetical protein